MAPLTHEPTSCLHHLPSQDPDSGPSTGIVYGHSKVINNIDRETRRQVLARPRPRPRTRAHRPDPNAPTARPTQQSCTTTLRPRRPQPRLPPPSPRPPHDTSNTTHSILTTSSPDRSGDSQIPLPTCSGSTPLHHSPHARPRPRQTCGTAEPPHLPSTNIPHLLSSRSKGRVTQSSGSSRPSSSTLARRPNNSQHKHCQRQRTLPRRHLLSAFLLLTSQRFSTAAASRFSTTLHSVSTHSSPWATRRQSSPTRPTARTVSQCAHPLSAAGRAVPTTRTP